MKDNVIETEGPRTSLQGFGPVSLHFPVLQFPPL